MTSRIFAHRRRFLRHLTLGGAVASSGAMLPLRAMAHEMEERFSESEYQALAHQGHRLKVSFDHGVASGDPLARQLIIWTRVTSERGGMVPVLWEVASDRHFRRVVRKGISRTGSERDHTVKVDVRGLRPDTRYYYRFIVGRSVSPVGRGRTLPVGRVAQVKLAVFACSN